ncbi:hypothetical protein [Streptosporangium canum]|uniref:hypothetical protein n=1 Tax=Streptosporangium canum TaxID=324952 RepID=UPI000B88BAD1|nr:hypothetical protein [Streptosporangium canum]
MVAIPSETVRSDAPRAACAAAERLRTELAALGVRADVHAGYGVALVSVWRELLVWTDGTVYRWWTGHLSPKTRRRLYTAYGVDNPAAAARCVAHRREELQQAHTSSEPIAEQMS